MTSAPQKVASTLQIIAFDPFHRRATVTAWEGGVSFSGAGLAGRDARCIAPPDETTEGGRVGSRFMGMAMANSVFVQGNIPNLVGGDMGMWEFGNSRIITF